jgi:RNA polymerase sigma-70 factor (ECF subfamily)
MDAAHAFERLVAEHERDVLHVARAVLRDEHLGRDAAQEAFVRLWRALAEGRAPVRAAAWLRRAALSAALDLQRTRRAHALELSASDPAGPTPEPGADALRSELAARLARAVAELPEGQRTIFLLRHEGGYPLAEVAEALDLGLATVKTQFARACLKLQQALRPFDQTGERED